MDDEKKMRARKVKQLAKEELNPAKMKVSSCGTDVLADIATEFIQFISIAALDRSERPKQYVDSAGVVDALRDLGFEDIAAQIPDIPLTEDMHKE